MKNCEIAKIIGREIIDSRGNPTVEAEITLANVSGNRYTLSSYDMTKYVYLDFNL